MSDSFCAFTGKIKYASRGDAQKALSRAISRGFHNRRLEVYRCSRCQQFHMGTRKNVQPKT